MNSSPQRVLIAGAGIGGLTAAIALQQAGLEVQVLEKTAELQPVGAGISLQINAMAALKRIGLAEQIREAGNVIDHARVVRGNGKTLSTVPFAEVGRERGLDFVTIHRGRLQDILVEALGRQHVRTGVTVEQIEETENQVRVRLPDGQFAEADLLVGADGIHSQVRAYLWGAQPKRYTGYSAWRGICANPHVSPQDEFVEVWGDRQVFGYVPIDADSMYWFGTKLTPAGDTDDGDPRDEIVRRFGSLPEPVQTLIESTPPECLLRNDIYDRSLQFPWGKGRITLLGDAAHPMTPNMGQGGCQAIEDALILAHRLSQQRDVEVALRAYETQRHRRTAMFVKHSRLLTAMAHGHPLWARTARATAIRWMPHAVKVRQMRDLYRFDLD